MRRQTSNFILPSDLRPLTSSNVKVVALFFVLCFCLFHCSCSSSTTWRSKAKSFKPNGQRANSFGELNETNMSACFRNNSTNDKAIRLEARQQLIDRIRMENSYIAENLRAISTNVALHRIEGRRSLDDLMDMCMSSDHAVRISAAEYVLREYGSRKELDGDMTPFLLWLCYEREQDYEKMVFYSKMFKDMGGEPDVTDVMLRKLISFGKTNDAGASRDQPESAD